jgi:hypothetical protein
VCSKNLPNYLDTGLSSRPIIKQTNAVSMAGTVTAHPAASPRRRVSLQRSPPRCRACSGVQCRPAALPPAWGVSRLRRCWEYRNVPSMLGPCRYRMTHPPNETSIRTRSAPCSAAKSIALLEVSAMPTTLCPASVTCCSRSRATKALSSTIRIFIATPWMVHQTRPGWLRPIR